MSLDLHDLCMTDASDEGDPVISDCCIRSPSAERLRRESVMIRLVSTLLWLAKEKSQFNMEPKVSAPLKVMSSKLVFLRETKQ